ncbi:MAG: gfo/Idh/MocA family oxidoreductase, partial [Planctomyces sp.]
ENGIWNGHSRKRGVELTVEGLTPLKMKNTINNHYNGSFLEPWGERAQRGYGIEVIDRFARETAWVEYGGPAGEREQRLQQIRQLSYADLAADRQVVAAVEAMERILEEQAAGRPDRVARYDGHTIRLC